MLFMHESQVINPTEDTYASYTEPVKVLKLPRFWEIFHIILYRVYYSKKKNTA